MGPPGWGLGPRGGMWEEGDGVERWGRARGAGAGAVLTIGDQGGWLLTRLLAALLRPPHHLPLRDVTNSGIPREDANVISAQGETPKKTFKPPSAKKYYVLPPPLN